jgi:hypothetical protein
VRSNASAHLLHISVGADINPWFRPYAEVRSTDFEVGRGYKEHIFSPSKGVYAVKVASNKARTYVHEDVSIEVLTDKKVVVKAAGWMTQLTRRRLYKPQPGSKVRDYLDVEFQAPLSVSSTHVAHGILGQSFASALKLNGKVDDYVAKEVTTSAQAEGAIEGKYTDYMTLPFDTKFKFSRFDASARPNAAAAAAAANKAAPPHHDDKLVDPSAGSFELGSIFGGAPPRLTASTETAEAAEPE